MNLVSYSKGVPARIFATRTFRRFTRDQRILDGDLVGAVGRAEAGLIDADLGGGVIKPRIARTGGGKSAGYRTLIAFRSEHRAVFVFGFAKSDRANVDRSELAALRLFAADLLASGEAEVERALRDGSLVEIER